MKFYQNFISLLYTYVYYIINTIHMNQEIILEKIYTVVSKLDTRMDRLEIKVDRIEVRLDKIEGRITTLEDKVNNLKIDMHDLLDASRSTFTNHEMRLATLERV